MARRTGSTLAALLALAAVLPVVLIAGPAGPASASAGGGQSSQGPVSVAITGMTPRQAAPGSRITISGTLTNTSGQQISHLAVQLLYSANPLTSTGELAPATAVADGLAIAQVPGAQWLTGGQLAAGASTRWSITFKASALGMTGFGVYPVAAQAISTLVQIPLATTYTYLPYVPARKSAYASTLPHTTSLSWLWPLIDQPMLTEPWAGSCQAPQAQRLAASLTASGRLGQLVAAGAGNTDLTWAIDPALLANVKALTHCSGAQARWAATASAWLTRLTSATASKPVFVTPYANPSVAALIAASHAADVRRAFQLGRAIGGRILHRDVSPAVSGSTAAASTTGIAWPADGIDGYPTLENLAAANGVSTVVLPSSELPDASSSVLTAANGLGGYLHLVLASSALTSILTAGGSTAASAFSTSQEILAGTALLAEQAPGTPIVVAPPQRWLAAPGLASQVLATTSAAPWLTPASLGSLTSARHLPVVSHVTTTGSWSRINRRVLKQITVLDQQIGQLQSIKQRPDGSLYQAMAAIESSAWRGSDRTTALAMMATMSRAIARQQDGVQVVAEDRVTLGGLKGSVPVSIENRLAYPVQVRLRLQFGQDGGNVKVTQQPGGLITVQARTAQTVRVRLQASQVGSTTITMTLQNRAFQALPGARTQRMTVQATQVGVLGMIICAIALGVLLIAYAARAARRGRPAPGAAGAPAAAAAPDGGTPSGGTDAESGSGAAVPPTGERDLRHQAAEPDSVMAERTELRTARPPGS